MSKQVVVFILILMFLAAGCSSEKSSSSKEIEKLGPQQLVEAYYRSLGEKDYDRALTCLSEEMAEKFPKLPDSDFKNLKKISNVKVTMGTPMYGGDNPTIQVVATYDAEYKKVITSQSGRKVCFVNVARKDKKSPWKIVSIGCGP